MPSMEFDRGDDIGYGSFSTVNLAKLKNQSPHFPSIMAVKSSSFPLSDMLLREKSILEELQDCPQIIRCFGGNYSVENGNSMYNLFLEYATGGTLSEKMNTQIDRRLPESEVRRYTKTILEGIKYIHDSGYIHCDLKLDNILICPSAKDSECFDTVKIADFGLAVRAGEKREKEGMELRGTPMYLSPEAVVSGEQRAVADVWAVGCMVAEMIAGVPAWKVRPETGMLQLMMRIGVGDELPEIPTELSPEGKDFLRKIFVKDPEKRWTAQMLLDHPFVAEVSPSNNSPRGPFDFSDDCRSVQTPCAVTKLPLSDFDTWALMDPCTDPHFLVTETPLSDFDTWASIEVDESQVAERLRKLVTCQGPEWTVTDSWINVREL